MLLPLHAQKSTTYGFLRLAKTEMADSLFKINTALEKVQKELDLRFNGTVKIKEGYYYNGGGDKAVDSLYNLKWELTSKRLQLLQNHEKELGLDIHLMNAGKYVRKAYALEFFALAFGITGGTCLGMGIANDKTALKATGIVSGVAAVGCFIGAYTCHFKSGQELRLAANSITYSF